MTVPVPAVRRPCSMASPTLSSSRPCSLYQVWVIEQEDKEEDMDQRKTFWQVCLVMCWRVSFKVLQATTVELMAVEVGEDLGASSVVVFPFPCSPAILIASSDNSTSSNPTAGCLGHRIHFPAAITVRMIHEEAGARMR